MKNSTKSKFTGDFGKLMKKNGFKYYEKMPQTRSKSIYIDMGLGYTNEYKRKNVKDYCLYYSETESTKDLCDKIPRCLGYIPNHCLVSYKALASTDMDNYDFEYHEKINDHAIFKFIEDNLLGFGFVTAAIIIIEVALFNFDFLRPILKNTIRITDGSMTYIGGRKVAMSTYEF